jgi:hypothetical protein
VTRVRLPLLLSVAVVAGLTGAFPVAGHAASSPPPYGTIWAADSAANAVVGYTPGSSSSAVTIAGADTGLDAPSGVAVDASGVVYVANAGSDSITSYAPDASGDAPPTATIAGSKTGLAAPSSIALGGDHTVWITDPGADLVEGFSTDTSGNELPAETITGPKTKLNHPTAVAVDRFADAIHVLNTPGSGKPSVTSYFATTFGNVKPAVRTRGTTRHPLTDPTAVLANDEGSFWVADAATNTVSLFIAFPDIGLPGFSFPTKAIRRIAGSHTGLDHPTALSTDALGHLLVANSGDDTVRVFGRHAKGDVHPLSQTAGVGSTAAGVTGLAVFGDAPGRPTGLRATRHGTTATLSWNPPANTGGGVIGYNFIKAHDIGGFGFRGFDGLLGLLTIGGGLGGFVQTHATTVTTELKPGHRYIFAVQAVNAFGASTFSKPAKLAFVTRPTPPRHVLVSSGKRSIVVNWKPPARDGGDELRGYLVQYATCVPDTKGCRFKTSHVKGGYRGFDAIRGLEPATKYYVRVIARTKSRQSAPTPAKSVVTQG